MTTDSTIFDYLLMPHEVQANTTVDLVLTLKNQGNSQHLTPNDEIYLALPAGSSDSDLAANLDDINPIAPDNWRFSKTQGGRFNLIISPTVPVTVESDQTLQFRLQSIVINPLASPNTTTVLNEFIGTHVGATSFTIAKTQPTFSITAQAIPSTVGKNQQTTLKWATVEAAYVVINPGGHTVDASGEKFVTPSQDVFSDPSQVTYTLTAYQASGGDFRSKNVVATISPPVITSFGPQSTPPINLNDQVNLSWQVKYAEQVQLTLASGATLVPAEVKALTVSPKDSLASGNESSVTYTLYAVGAGQPAKAQLTIPFNPVVVDYFRFPDATSQESYEVQITNGYQEVQRVQTSQGVYFKLTATGPHGPKVQYLGDYDSLQIQVFTSQPDHEGVILNWQTKKAVSLLLNPGNIQIEKDMIASGSMTVKPQTTTTYQLTAQDECGETIISRLTVEPETTGKG